MDTATSSTGGSDAAAPGRGKNIALWVLQVIVALSMLSASLTKVTAYPASVETFDKIGFGSWFMYAIGALELAGAIAVLVPILSGLAALGVSLLLVGAIITEFLIGDSAAAIVPAIYLIPAVIVAWGRRDRTTQLISRLRR